MVAMCGIILIYVVVAGIRSFDSIMKYELTESVLIW